MADKRNHLILRAPLSTVGYHGCERDVAERLLDGEPFRMSVNDYDWLGSGVYFWEYAPFRAKKWAEEQYGNRGVVVRANILLGDCLNLLDTEHFFDLQAVYSAAFDAFQAQGRALPKNRRGANRLDRMVIDGFVSKYMTQGGFFDTVRGCFPEGIAIFEGSQLLSHTHVQIAVRNQACIGNLELVNFE